MTLTIDYLDRNGRSALLNKLDRMATTELEKSFHAQQILEWDRAFFARWGPLDPRREADRQLLDATVRPPWETKR